MNKPVVLVVDDEVHGLETLVRTLSGEFEVKTARSAVEARAVLEHEWVQVILCDQRISDTSGVEFLCQVREQWPEVMRMIVSGHTDPEEIIDAVNEAGVYHYVTKPWRPENLIRLLKEACRLFELHRHNELLSIELKTSPDHLASAVSEKRETMRARFLQDDGIVRTAASKMNQVCERVKRVSPYDISVLLTGESGTGKELAARALHYNSRRWEKPFVVENCGALPDELLESELFGYKRGAFTGAVEDRVGLFERANGGTVFLDEIGELSPAFQVKLLRVLQEGEVRPLGSGRTRTVDVRIIAATNKELETEVRAGRFREDLYYRLAAVNITLPPLRERPDDVEVLADALLAKAMERLGKRVKGFTEEAVACMRAYHWAGNVRELKNEIQHMLVMSDGEWLGADLLSPRVLHAVPPEREPQRIALDSTEGSLKERVEDFEARILRETLIRHRWNKSRAAKELGLSRVGLRGKLERYGLERVGGAEAMGD